MNIVQLAIDGEAALVSLVLHVSQDGPGFVEVDEDFVQLTVDGETTVIKLAFDRGQIDIAENIVQLTIDGEATDIKRRTDGDYVVVYNDERAIDIF